MKRLWSYYIVQDSTDHQYIHTHIPDLNLQHLKFLSQSI
jgi:hypothetical protein